MKDLDCDTFCSFTYSTIPEVMTLIKNGQTKPESGSQKTLLTHHIDAVEKALEKQEKV